MSWFELDDFRCLIEFIAELRSWLLRAYCAALFVPPFSQLRKASLALLFCLTAELLFLVFSILCQTSLAMLFCLTAELLFLVFYHLCKVSLALFY